MRYKTIEDWQNWMSLKGVPLSCLLEFAEHYQNLLSREENERNFRKFMREGGSESYNGREIVMCTNCGKYYSVDDLELDILYDEDDKEKEHPYSGCGECKTDKHLIRITPDLEKI